MNIDLLFDAVTARGHVCVGLDTATDYLPPAVLKNAASPAQAILAFNKALIDATLDVCACYKVQIAYYEELGLAGLEAFAKTLAYIREKGGLAISDIKRGDIADTATRYARGHFSGDFETDFVTLSPYMGMDSIEPWRDFARESGKGMFVLVRTSNKGYRDFEQLELAPELHLANGGKRVYDAVATKLVAANEGLVGKSGYGPIGAVIGCTERAEAAEIRARYPSLFFLIPGYGAQGGAAEDAALLLRSGNGGVVNASRSILKAWVADTAGRDPATVSLDDCAAAARRASIAMRDDIRAACKAGAACDAGGTGERP